VRKYIYFPSAMDFSTIFGERGPGRVDFVASEMEDELLFVGEVGTV